MKKLMYMAIGVIAVVAIFMVAGFIKGDAVATVNGTTINQEELYEQMVKTNGTETLDLMISDEIINQEAEKAEIEVTQEEIDAELAVYEENYGGAEALQAAIEASGITMDDLLAEMETYLKIEKLIGPEIDITDESIAAYFEENKESFAQEEQVEASHILVETQEAADEVAGKLADGEDFAELVTEYSTDTATLETGGELGSFGKGQMAAEFEEAAFSMEEGEVSEPVETDYGFHVIKVTGKTAASEANLEDHQEEIEEMLFDEALSTQYAAWLAEKQESYDIQINLN